MALGDNPEQYDPYAIYTNRVAVTYNVFGVRLAFGESPDGSVNDEKYVSAIFLPHAVFNSMMAMLKGIPDQQQQELPLPPERRKRN